jgi:hypothetical protein
MTADSGICIAFPDVCKTPAAPSPIPLPYLNTASCSDGDGAKKVAVLGKAILRKGDKIRRSSGDEAGTLMGVVSNRNMDCAVIRTGSPKVKVEKKDCAFLTSVMGQNGNSSNAPPGVHIKPCQQKVFVFGVPAPSSMTDDEVLDWVVGTGASAVKALEVLDTFDNSGSDSGDGVSEEHVKDGSGGFYRSFDSNSLLSSPPPSPVSTWSWAGKLGGYASKAIPVSSASEIKLYALPKINNADVATEVALKPCTTSLNGPAGSQTHDANFHPTATGGGNQNWIPRSQSPGSSVLDNPMSTVGNTFPLP